MLDPRLPIPGSFFVFPTAVATARPPALKRQVGRGHNSCCHWVSDLMLAVARGALGTTQGTVIETEHSGLPWSTPANREEIQFCSVCGHKSGSRTVRLQPGADAPCWGSVGSQRPPCWCLGYPSQCPVGSPGPLQPFWKFRKVLKFRESPLNVIDVHVWVRLD